MARPRIWQSPSRSFCRNPPPADKDELAGATSRAFTNDNGTLSHISAVSRIPTPAPVPLFAPAKLMAKYTSANLQWTTKLALKLFVQS